MINNTPTYRSAVLLVKDIEKSKHFYNEILGQKIIMDFGKNMGFEGGFAIWEREYALNLIFQNDTSNIKVGINNLEIYFELNDLEDLYNQLKGKVKIIHPIREQPWGQRGFRVYDPDDHILEFAETMENVVLRLHRKGLDLDEIAKKSMMPIEFVQMTIKKP